MIERTKKGFSLVEVMILFTVLAVVMAASIPAMSRKVRAIPKKASHGIYRCVYEGNTLKEYLFEGSKAIYGNGGRVAPGGVCSFNVPSASVYKVDLYSAGAGGTKYADVTSRKDDDRTADYDMREQLHNQRGTGGNEPMRNIEEDDLKMFEGLNIIRTTNTKDAGKGGDANIRQYFTGIGHQCKGWNTMQASVNREYNKYFGKCVGPSNEYQTQLKIQEDNRKILKGLKDDYNAEKNRCNSTTEHCVYKKDSKGNKIPIKNKDGKITGYEEECTTTYDDSTCETCYHSTNKSARNTACGNLLNWENDAWTAYYNASKSCKDSTTSNQCKIDQAQTKIDDKIKPESWKWGCISTSGACSTGSNYCGTTLVVPACSGSACISNFTENVSSPVGSLRGLNEANAYKSWLDSGDLAAKADTLYKTKFAMVDITRSASNGSIKETGFMPPQFQKFCGIHFPNVSGTKLNSTDGAYDNSNAKNSIMTPGGAAGLGYYMQLVYPIRYVASNLNGSSRKTYLSHLVTPGNADAVYIATCRGENSTAANYLSNSNCYAGDGVQKGKDGTSVDIQNLLVSHNELKSVTDDSTKVGKYNFVKLGTDSTRTGSGGGGGGGGTSCSYSFTYYRTSDGAPSNGCYCYADGYYCSGGGIKTMKKWYPQTPGYNCSALIAKHRQEVEAACSSGGGHTEPEPTPDCGNGAYYNTSSKSCVCNNSVETYLGYGKCKLKCPNYYVPVNSSGVDDGYCHAAGLKNPDGCYGSHKKGGTCGSKCNDERGHCYAPNSTELIHYYWYQKVQNPQQYFKSEEYNNLFTFKNTLNMLGEMDLSSINGYNGTLLAGINTGCPNIDGCMYYNTQNCTCTKCKNGWELDRYFGGCSKVNPTTCGPSRDPVQLVPTGIGAKQQCVCPSGTINAGKDPFDGYNGLCNSKSTQNCGSSSDFFQLEVGIRNGVKGCLCPSNTLKAGYFVTERTDLAPNGKCGAPAGPNYGDEYTNNCVSYFGRGGWSCLNGINGATYGTCACSSSSQKYDYTKCACVNNSGGGGASYSGGDVSIRTLTSKGEDVKDYAAFHIPDINHASHTSANAGRFVSSVPFDGLAKGGYPAYIDITFNQYASLALPYNLVSNTTMYEGGYLSNDYSFTAEQNKLYGGVIPTPKGQDAVFSAPHLAGSLGRNPYITQSGGVTNTQPRMKIESDMWTKEVKTGRGGEPGRHEYFETTNLGTNCRMNVPHGGRVLNLLDPNNHTTAEALERDLAVNIRCTKGDTVTFNKTVKGGQYSRTFYTHDKFFWSRGLAVKNYPAIQHEAHRDVHWRPTSIWLNVYERILGGRNNYDLNNKNIAKGGLGTSVQDHCVVPKGKFTRYMVELLDINPDGITQGRSYTEREYSPQRRVEENFNGEYQGVQCYEPGTKVLYDNDPLRRSGIMDVSAGEGGGGAVVVTW